MSFVLKIVEGPNKGAEAALVEGVAVTVGKGDECDIVLADPSLPNVPVKIETTAEGVSVDGELMTPLHVRTLGNTSFAVGPANSSWGKLVWPESEKQDSEPASAKVEEKPADKKPDTEGKEKAPDKKRRSHGCLIWFIVILLLAAGLAGAGYYYRDWLMPRVEPYRPQAEEAWGWTKSHAKIASHWCADKSVVLYDKGVALYGKCVALYGEWTNRNEAPVIEEPVRDPAEVIAEIALTNGLDIAEEGGRLSIFGNLTTRAKRLAVTAEIYSALPCVELNLSDDETLKTAVEDTLNLIGESGLRVRAVTNRVAVLEGTSSDLSMITMRLSQEVPKIRAIDGGAIIRPVPAEAVVAADDVDVKERQEEREEPVAAQPQPAMPKLPVCGILTTPYPCLVTRSGARIMEGANLGEWTVKKIGADSVVLEGSAGRFVWRP